MTKKEFDRAVESAKAGMDCLEDFVEGFLHPKAPLFLADNNIDMTMALNYAKVAYYSFGYVVNIEWVFDYLAHWYSNDYSKVCVLVDFLYNYLSTIAEGGNAND